MHSKELYDSAIGFAMESAEPLAEAGTNIVDQVCPDGEPCFRLIVLMMATDIVHAANMRALAGVIGKEHILSVAEATYQRLKDSIEAA